jgi:uncharacterized protein with NRDE domain
MCLLAVLFHAHPEAPVVIAANRDERYARAAEAIQVLRESAPRILGGRDVLAGGTWLAVNEHGVYAGVTNRPSPTGRDPSRRSRGELPLTLANHQRARDAVAAFRKRIRCSEYNPCWLLVGDRDALFYVVVGGNEAPAVEELSPGVHVLENRPLAPASAKAEMIRLALLPAPGWLGPTLLGKLHGVLGSHDLPTADLREEGDESASTRPPQVHAACVHTPDYGTRSAALILVPFAPERAPQVHYADGPPCITPLEDASHLWDR